jgi:trans-aconitate 2-methyltransferase
MPETSRKHFGPIRDDYAFFQQHSTEAEEDLRAYVPHLHHLSMGDTPIRMLDFGCGDGGFTAEFLLRSRFPQERLWLSLVEPDPTYLHQAADRLQAYTSHPVCAWSALPPHLHAGFELILANHVLYYVPDLKATLAALLRALATPGLFLIAMGGLDNTLAQFCLRCFEVIGKPFPFRTAADCEVALAHLREAYGKEDVHYACVFPDTEESRLSMGRFLLGSDYHAVPRQALLQGFDPYVHAGQVAMQPVHQHFIVRRPGQWREVLAEQP